jgi:tetratricopeptide (TPR) repeat protein
MTKLWTTLWIIFTIVLISFPLWIVLILLSKRGKKILKLVKQKINNIKTLDKIRAELLQQRAKEAKEENNINENIVMSTIFENKKDENVNKEDNNTNKNIQEKQKKLLEKISYEANVFKKDWKLEDYEKKLIEWLAIDPENIELNKQLADLYFTIWNHKKALSLLKKIIEEDPEDHNAIRQIWEIYLITWDHETAELLIEKAINIKPNNPKYHISMVEILYNTERKKDAVAVMEKIVKLRPTNANYALTLAELYEEIQDKDNSKKYYFRVLEQEPNNEKAKKKIQELSSNTI